MGFEPCKMEPDIWLCPCAEDNYEYIDINADDLLIASKDPKGIIDILTNKHYFKLKGAGHISYHLGYDFVRDDDGTLCFAPKKHVDTMIDCYCKVFGTKTKLAFSLPLEEGDHPELETPEYLESDGMQ